MILAVAACTDYAGIKAFNPGPLAPAVLIAGQDSELTASELLFGTMEPFRGWPADESPRFDSVFREMGTAVFERASFTDCDHQRSKIYECATAFDLKIVIEYADSSLEFPWNSGVTSRRAFSCQDAICYESLSV